MIFNVEFRNKISHGLKYDDDWREKIIACFPHILNYLRISLLFFLYHYSMTKNEIVSRIQDSIFSDAEIKNLKKMVKNLSNDFKICLEKDVSSKIFFREDLVIDLKIK